MRESHKPADDQADTIKGCYFFTVFGTKIAMPCEPGSEKFWTDLGAELSRRVKEESFPPSDDHRFSEMRKIATVAIVALDLLAELHETSQRIAQLQSDLTTPRVH